MALYLIRCAKAARRDSWSGVGRLRPLTADGRAQAAGLAAWLADAPVSHVLSSPFARCVDTVSPVAEGHGLDVELVESLAPKQPVDLVIDWLRVLPDHSVLCSHGSTITRVMEILSRQGAVIDGPSDWRRAATSVSNARTASSSAPAPFHRRADARVAVRSGP